MADKSLLNYQSDESIGLVNAVDTGTAMALITDDKSLSQLQINQLLAVHSPRPGRHIIAMIIKIFRKSVLDDTVEVGEDEENDGLQTVSINQIKMVFIGEFIDCEGTRRNIFKRNVSAVPSIDADCYKIEGDRLTNLMQSISGIYAETRKNELDSVVENCYTILFSIRGLYCRGGYAEAVQFQNVSIVALFAIQAICGIVTTTYIAQKISVKIKNRKPWRTIAEGTILIYVMHFGLLNPFYHLFYGVWGLTMDSTILPILQILEAIVITILFIKPIETIKDKWPLLIGKTK